MSESEEETPSFPPKSKDVVDDVREAALMDFDLEIASPWPLDQIAFVSNPMSPLTFSSTEQPYSPLWAFCDGDNDEKLAGNVNSPIADCPRMISCEFILCFFPFALCGSMFLWGFCSFSQL